MKLIVATHWDDDHIKGIGNIVESCPTARFVMSSAINDTKFTKVVVDSPLSQAIKLGQTISTGITEFNKIFHYLFKNNKSPTYAIQNLPLWKSNYKNAKVTALSPHASAFEKSIQSILSQVPSGNTPIGKIKAQKPNHTSIVLWVEIGDERILLGADLEEVESHKGWSLILEDKTSIEGKAKLYKVAHHGSPNGEHEGIWTDLLTDDPHCLIAPWQLAGNFLPKVSDLERILQRTENLHLSSDKPQPAIKSKEKHIRRAMEKIKAKNALNDFSMIRLRKKSNATQWSCEYFGNAKLVKAA